MKQININKLISYPSNELETYKKDNRVYIKTPTVKQELFEFESNSDLKNNDNITFEYNNLKFTLNNINYSDNNEHVSIYTDDFTIEYIG